SNLARALETFAEWLSPAQAEEVMKQVLDVLDKPQALVSPVMLARMVRKLGERLPAEQAAETTARAAQQGVEGLARMTDATASLALAQAVGVLGQRLAPEQVAKATLLVLEVMSRTIDFNTLSSMNHAVGQLAGRLTPEQAAAATRQALDGLAGTTNPTTQT